MNGADGVGAEAAKLVDGERGELLTCDGGATKFEGVDVCMHEIPTYDETTRSEWLGGEVHFVQDGLLGR